MHNTHPPSLPGSQERPFIAARAGFLQSLLLGAALALLPGCAAPGAGSDPAATRAAWLADLRDVAHIGAQLDLASNPGHRAAYERAVFALHAIAETTNATPASLHAALAATLPVKELRGEKAILYVTAAQILMRRVMDGREVAVPENVRAVAGALRDGLRAAVK